MCPVLPRATAVGVQRVWLPGRSAGFGYLVLGKYLPGSFPMEGGIRTSITLLNLKRAWCLEPPTCPQGPRGLWVKFPSSNPHGSRALGPGPQAHRHLGSKLLPPPSGAAASAPELTLD